jgi:hypothetical protein
MKDMGSVLVSKRPALQNNLIKAKVDELDKDRLVVDPGKDDNVSILAEKPLVLLIADHKCSEQTNFVS